MHNSQTMPASSKETGFRAYIHPLIQRKLTIRHSKSKKGIRLLYKYSHIVHPVFRKNNPVTISAFRMTFHKRAYTFLHSIRNYLCKRSFNVLRTSIRGCSKIYPITPKKLLTILITVVSYHQPNFEHQFTKSFESCHV